MISGIFSRLIILVFGTLYPAYYSFKTVRAKCVDEYMKWMMYWIVFAIFTAGETFTDIFLKWLPFYYELKILFIFWLLPSMGNGSPMIYRKCLNPFLKKHEPRIDHALVQLKHRGQDIICHYVSEAVLYIGRALMNIVHKNIPNGVMGLMASHHEERHIVTNSTLVIEEMEPPSTSAAAAKVSRRKSPGRVAQKLVEVNDMDLQTTNSRGRSRKARHPKPNLDLDINLNES